ncbi:peptide-methionine (S)-S-oxide reductase MsrA [Capnocytophaga sp. oral taxon 878]|uniref:peptide-methionine (S)-S-oxide reductase MsrA n=1 Tax=Capnocytophaga sp. oral taxon 878 TaxID=1316596 RepID=UPI000D03453C|nr:peptide-methionine (S)-S-oxide reductase MsrA [Capnocytophaga sp. oral taxon 878]AVM49142.1 peptide-methionine (S)-S-oxide reductase [Capnocytophaga sp. oral taxon 878]
MSKIQQVKPANEIIYLAGGCFWGTEYFYKRVRGVLQVQSGYVNGHTNKPIYEEVMTGTTGYAEAVKITYDPQQISLKKLLTLFFTTINPTSLNKQGSDVGTQYRTGIYYLTPAQKITAQAALRRLAAHYTEPVVVECEPFKVFQPAEEWHIDYLEKFPSVTCHINPTVLRNARMANPIPLSKKKHNLNKLRKLINH